jgi:hypothetical protein
MPEITITLSEAQRSFVADDVKARRLQSADIYISQLILKEQLKRQRARIEPLLLESIHSPDTPMTQQDWLDIENEGMVRLAEEKCNP